MTSIVEFYQWWQIEWSLILILLFLASLFIYSIYIEPAMERARIRRRIMRR